MAKATKAKPGHSDSVRLEFSKERETKGTWRFQEEHDDTEEPMVGTIYVRKSALAKLGNPERLVLTVEGR